MQFFNVAALVAVVAGVKATHNHTMSIVTGVVTAVTTYCPGATQITYGGSTYTVTEATTLTISNCPGGCTVTQPVYVTSAVICKACDTVTPLPTPIPSSSSVDSYIYRNGTVTTSATSATRTVSASAVSAHATAGAAGQAAALSGGALAGLLGMAAFIF